MNESSLLDESTPYVEMTDKAPLTKKDKPKLDTELVSFKENVTIEDQKNHIISLVKNAMILKDSCHIYVRKVYTNQYRRRQRVKAFHKEGTSLFTKVLTVPLRDKYEDLSEDDLPYCDNKCNVIILDKDVRNLIDIILSLNLKWQLIGHHYYVCKELVISSYNYYKIKPK
jgi:hypothetical protein